MKKYVSSLCVSKVERPHREYALLKLSGGSEALPDMQPGQFVQVKIEGTAQTFLRRPISINYVDRSKNELWLLVHVVGEGTRRLAELKEGCELNCLFPLGRGFSIPEGQGKKVLLVGGGVGTAPLLFLGERLFRAGHVPVFLLGGKRREDLLQLDLFAQFGRVLTTTEDGSSGCKGFVTEHPVWKEETFDFISTCGPKPMMAAVARMAQVLGAPCEASLENLMACGLGACLCCVEKTRRGNVCVCTEGPVFNTKELTWLISA